MKRDIALNIAHQIVALLEPFCDRVEIAGSLRRKNFNIGDIDIVCIPKVEQDSADLFGNKFYRVPGFSDAVNKIGNIFIGKPDTGKRVGIHHKSGIPIELYITDELNWGYIFFIRTGPAEYSHGMAKKWCLKGYHGENGKLYKNADGGKDKQHIILKEEKDLYEVLGYEYIEPENRG